MDKSFSDINHPIKNLKNNNALEHMCAWDYLSLDEAYQCMDNFIGVSIGSGPYGFLYIVSYSDILLNYL